ncbi:hypothetical protein RPD76_07680 [Methylomonas sp. MV1]|uniref:hypothetical protein n=1 Tax=Methylomonas sp. MV1 TaxID=3073620 RepID=UPI0028A43614|nr:hypothetical protein [Methylomonas sp. MV1]MDT4329786.1 hypothetical protein [Methylomonas sp. MV1]
MQKLKSITPPELGDGPPTPELLEKWCSWLEDIATAERDIGHADRIVMLELLIELARSGLIDINRLLKNLTRHLPHQDHEGERLALKLTIDELAQVLTPAATALPGETPTH